MKDPAYRVRFELVSLAQMFAGLPRAQRFPLRCWRVTFVVGAAVAGGPILDQQNLVDVLNPGGIASPAPVSFSVGGVFMPDGSPAVVDQTLFANLSGAFRQCPVLLVLEYLEPWQP